MAETADLVVVGAGIAGSSVAFFAAKSGMKVIVVEKDFPGGTGATSGTAAFIRCHYTNPHEVRFAVEGWQIQSNWADIVGGSSGFRKIGHLFIVGPTEVEKLRRNTEFVADQGVNTYVIGPDELKELLPYMNTEGIGGAAWEPDSGHADPTDSVNTLLAGVKERGGRVISDAMPVELIVENDRIAGVRAKGETISAPNVVLATGAGTSELCKSIGLDVPVQSMPIGAGVMLTPPEMNPLPPATIDHAAQQWYRGDVGDHMFLGSGYEDYMGFNTDPDAEAPPAIPPTQDELVASAMRLTQRFPALENARPSRTWARNDSLTPDGHAIVGPVEEVPGLFLFTGGNGKLFKLAPSMGRSLADVIRTGQFAESPLAPFSLDRFAAGRVVSTGEWEYAWGSFA
jgi:sarcosine oxidase subunit beta